jgi:hypothetical protein
MALSVRSLGVISLCRRSLRGLSARKLPCCGVAMKITRFTSGTGSTKYTLRNSALASGDRLRSSGGLALSVSQIRDPLSIASHFASSPP